MHPLSSGQVITARHIRKGYATWIDSSETHSVTTMCGVRSTNKFCGIPGITDQKVSVQTKNGERLGWCLNCCKVMAAEVYNFLEGGAINAHPSVITCYADAAEVLVAVKAVSMFSATEITAP
jgi:hypothetical protein